MTSTWIPGATADRHGRPTIICAAHDRQHDEAVALAELLRDG